jgi:hypothetical protein
MAYLVPAMPSVSVSLDEITCSGPGSGSDHRSSFTADQRTTHSSCDAAYNRASSSTVMVSSITPLCKAHAAKNSEQQCHAQDCGYYAFFQDRTYHCRTFLSSNGL